MGIIKSENWDGVSAPAIPSGWTVDTPLVTATTNSPTSAPNSLVYPVASADGAVVPHATWATQDTNAGNVRVSATVRFANAAAAGEQDVWLFARSPVVASNANNATATYYICDLSRNVSAGLALQKRVSGSLTTLGRVGAGAFADAADYRIALVCFGSTMQATCQRLSDGFWLNSSGVFVSDPSGQTVAISATDTSIAASAGYSGAAFYLAGGAGGSVGLDDWLLETRGTIAASPATLAANSGAQSVTLTGVGTNFSTTSSTQFTLSGGTGASIVSQSASSATSATLLVNPGTAVGTLVVTDTTDGSITTTIAVTSGRAATTFYVSPSGSDSNNGTSTATAWQTIGHVNAQTFQPGDQILFLGGQSFSGNLVIQQSGSAALPIVVGSYGTGAATIAPGTGTGIQIKDAAYVRVHNLSVVGAGVTVSGSTSSTTSTGYGVEVLSTATQASVAAWRQSIYLDSLTISGCHDGILCHSYGGSAAGPYPVGFADLRITNCTVSHCLGMGIDVWSNSSSSPFYLGLENGTGNVPYHKDVYIGGCRVSDIYGDSGWPLPDGHVTGTGILVGNTNVGTTERCLLTNCGQATPGTSGGGVGTWVYASKSYVIQYCESCFNHDPLGLDGGGFDIDGGCTSCVVQYCYSHDNDGVGYECGNYPGSGLTDGNTFRYCISQNDGRTVAGPVGFRFFSAPTNTTVHNCTFYASSPGTNSDGMLEDLGGGSVNFYNNIFWCPGGLALLSSFLTTSSVFAANLYWFGGGAFSVVYNGVTYSSLGAWQALQETAGGVPTGVFADPLLVAPGTGGTLLPGTPVAALGAYALRASSPAIDAGLDLHPLFGLEPGLIDFTGRPNRAGAGVDIGACEYGASALLGASGGGGGVRRPSMDGGL